MCSSPGSMCALLVALVAQSPSPALVDVPRPSLTAIDPAVAAQLQRARAALDARVAARTADADSFGLMGRQYHAYAMADAAEGCYRNAALLAPTEFRWPYLLGVLFEEHYRLDEAAASLTRALAMPDRYYPAMVRLAAIDLARGRLDAAEAAVVQARTHAADDPALIAVAGELALARKQYSEAVTLLSRALASQPRATRLHYPLGMAYRALGRLSDARDHLAQAGEVGVRPLDPVADEVLSLRQGEHVFMMDGHAALRAGDLVGAGAAFTRALEASGGRSISALINLAAADAKRGRTAEALQHLQRAAELAPRDVTVQFNLGVLLAFMRRPVEAEPILREVVSRAPDDQAARVALALTLVALRKYLEGLELLEDVTDVDPARCAEVIAAVAEVAQLPGESLRARASRVNDRIRRLPACAGVPGTPEPRNPGTQEPRNPGT